MALEFTGERYVPQLRSGKISYEHWHRYIFAKPFCKNKKVLDIACGEGYGTAFLASLAEHITGIDVSPEAIAHATEAYQPSNVQFITGDAGQAFPFQDCFFDTIVCFETIEHLDQDDQHAFMKEAVRVIAKDGVLLISTPNKKIYSDDKNYKNPFHLTEFYEGEFDTFLKQYFSNVSIYKQQIVCGSLIEKQGETQNAIEHIHLTESGYKPGRINKHMPSEYLIAVCFNQKNSNAVHTSGSILLDEDNLLYNEKFV